MKTDFYVYALFRETGEPFYIGKGRNRRWLEHEIHAHKRKSHKDNIICKMRALGFSDIPKVKIREDLTSQEAGEIEVALIAAIGRRPDGPLCNQTRGGEGVVDPSPELREKFSRVHKGRKLGRPRTAEWIERHRQYQTGKAIPQEIREKIRAALKGKPLTAETRAKMSASRKGRLLTPMTPEIRAKISASLTGRKLPPEQLAQMSALQKQRYRDDPNHPLKRPKL